MPALGADLANDHGRLVDTGVVDDLPGRLLEGAEKDLDAGLDVAFARLDELFDRIHGAKQRDAAAGHDALFDSRLGGVQRVLDAGLLLFHLGLGGSADLDLRHTADQLGQTLLELLTVVVRGGFLDLTLDLADAAEHGLVLGLVVVVDDDRWCRPC